jgi:hypothetical protein
MADDAFMRALVEPYVARFEAMILAYNPGMRAIRLAEGHRPQASRMIAVTFKDRTPPPPPADPGN